MDLHLEKSSNIFNEEDLEAQSAYEKHLSKGKVITKFHPQTFVLIYYTKLFNLLLLVLFYHYVFAVISRVAKCT